MKLKLILLSLIVFLLVISTCKKDVEETQVACNNPSLGCLKTTIGLEEFEGLAVSGTFTTPFYIIAGSTLNSSSLSLAIMPKPVGTYNFDEDDNVFTYVDHSLSTGSKIYEGKSGTYTLSTVDTDQKILVGSFDLVMEASDSTGVSTINLTNGSFSVTYD